MSKPKSPRELAARALCSFNGIPENIVRDKKPMWIQYLEEVDVVLQAALSYDEWQRMKDLGPH